MSTTPELTTPDTPAHTLTPVLGARYALRWQHCVLVGMFVVMFMYVSYLPLSNVVVWRHAGIGEAILSQGRLPAVEPSLPLAEGMRWFAACWGGDVVLAAAHRAGGTALVSGLQAFVVLAMMLLFARTVYLLTARKRFVVLAVAALFAAHWSRLAIPRPELLGLGCLGILLWLLARESTDPQRTNRWIWLALPGLFAVWANLDASVVLGVMVLGCWAVGEIVDVALLGNHVGRNKSSQFRQEPGNTPPPEPRKAWFRPTSLWSAIGDPRLQRSLLLAQLATAATLLQPQGLDLWADWMFGINGVVGSSLGGLRPLQLVSLTGAACTSVWLLAALALRFSRRRIQAVEVLLLLVASLWVALNDACLIWFVPVALFALLPHLADLADRIGWLGERSAPPEFKAGEPVAVGTFAFSVVALLLIWVGFALSPVSTPLLGGKSRKAAQLHSSTTPWIVSQYLESSATAAFVLAPGDWGDWIAWAGPPGTRVYANSQLGRLPKRAQLDYFELYSGKGDWRRLCDRYDVGLLVIDTERQPQLTNVVLETHDGWEIAVQDEQTLVLKRSGV